jgi:hypothetical protein
VCAICSEYGHYTHHCPALPRFQQALAIVSRDFQNNPRPDTSSTTPITDIRYVTTSVNERMRCPCSLCDSLDHFTYQCPMIIEYRQRQLALLQQPAEAVIDLTSSLENLHVISPELEALPTPPWFLDDVSEDFTRNPPNSPAHFSTETIHPTTTDTPQYLNIWFMSSEPSPHITPSDCAGHEALSFMDGFSSYNQIQIHPADQYKTAFITPWGTFAYRVMPFGLKNAGATFQRAMTYIFHDLAAIILAYLDDLTARSKNRTQHIDDLRIIFQRCRQYNIRLNPLKCVFCVTAGRLLGFIVSQSDITVDPLKVQAITEIPPPRNLRQLQSLQGKANFLRHFVPNYAIRTHGFLRLLHHDIPFHWDDYAQQSFDDLKEALSIAPLISAPDYNRDYILYVSASAVSVASVLVQLGDDNRQWVIPQEPVNGLYLKKFYA